MVSKEVSPTSCLTYLAQVGRHDVGVQPLGQALNAAFQTDELQHTPRLRLRLRLAPLARALVEREQVVKERAVEEDALLP